MVLWWKSKRKVGYLRPDIWEFRPRTWQTLSSPSFNKFSRLGYLTDWKIPNPTLDLSLLQQNFVIIDKKGIFLCCTTIKKIIVHILNYFSLSERVWNHNTWNNPKLFLTFLTRIWECHFPNVHCVFLNFLLINPFAHILDKKIPQFLEIGPLPVLFSFLPGTHRDLRLPNQPRISNSRIQQHLSELTSMALKVRRSKKGGKVWSLTKPMQHTKK